MTSWNYRVIKKDICEQEASYQIHEVYYSKDGSIDCWNHTPVEPLGVSEPGLRNDIQAFLVAFRLPVLEERFINGKAKLVEEHMQVPSTDLKADYASKTTRASGYLNQILGNHLLLKQEPSLRQAYDQVDQALANLQAVVSQQDFALAV
mgnify:CR=1 FL=1